MESEEKKRGAYGAQPLPYWCAVCLRLRNLSDKRLPCRVQQWMGETHEAVQNTRRICSVCQEREREREGGERESKQQQQQPQKKKEWHRKLGLKKKNKSVGVFFVEVVRVWC